MTTLRADADGATLHVEVDGSGPPVVLVGGFASDASFWGPTVHGLADRFRLVRFDPRGMGRSSAAPGIWTTDTLAGDVRAVLDAVGVDRAHLVGHSLGGAVAQAFALTHPDRLDRLVLVSTFPRGPRAGPLRTGLWPDILERLGPEAFIDNMLAWCIASTALEDRWPWVQALRATLVRHLMQHPIDVDALRSHRAAIRDHDLAASSGMIKARSLVLVGDEDILTPPMWSRALAQAIPGAALAIVPGAGHFLPIEQPSVFHRHLLTFLNVRGKP